MILEPPHTRVSHVVQCLVSEHFLDSICTSLVYLHSSFQRVPKETVSIELSMDTVFVRNYKEFQAPFICSNLKIFSVHQLWFFTGTYVMCRHNPSLLNSGTSFKPWLALHTVQNNGKERTAFTLSTCALVFSNKDNKIFVLGNSYHSHLIERRTSKNSHTYL